MHHKLTNTVAVLHSGENTTLLGVSLASICMRLLIKLSSSFNFNLIYFWLRLLKSICLRPCDAPDSFFCYRGPGSQIGPNSSLSPNSNLSSSSSLIDNVIRRCFRLRIRLIFDVVFVF